MFFSTAEVVCVPHARPPQPGSPRATDCQPRAPKSLFYFCPAKCWMLPPLKIPQTECQLICKGALSSLVCPTPFPGPCIMGLSAFSHHPGYRVKGTPESHSRRSLGIPFRWPSMGLADIRACACSRCARSPSSLCSTPIPTPKRTWS